MTALEVLGYVYRKNGVIRIEGDTIFITLKDDYFTDDFKAAVKIHKPELMRYVKSRNGVFPDDR